MADCIVVLSGGQDSTTCLFKAKTEFDNVHTITIDYGQRHAIEIECAKTIAKIAEVTNEIISIPNVLKGTSPLVSSEKLEEYKDHQSLPGGLEKTFVPCRNLLFLTIAVNRAYCAGIDYIVTGVCEEDFGGYPDCRRDFIDSLEYTLYEGLDSENAPYTPNIVTPLMSLTKAETVKLALEYDNCYTALAYSHTSYGGEYPPTTNDHANLLRAKGFEEANIPDPLIVRAYWENKIDVLPDTSNYDRVRNLIVGRSSEPEPGTIYNRLHNLELLLRD
jgi:7-cyano-7-deazaguanine synthase